MRPVWALIAGALLYAASVAIALAGPVDDASTAISRKDYATALALLRPLAQQGDPRAQAGLGYLMADGLGTPRNETAALVWYRRAADQGLARAQNQIGIMYAGGRAVAQSDAEAVAWYRKAADQGYAPAQFNLGNHYRAGKGVPRDLSQAANWFVKAAEQGNLRAQFSLGLAYERGEGVGANPYRAMELYDRVLGKANEADFRSKVLAARGRVASQLIAGVQSTPSPSKPVLSAAPKPEPVNSARRPALPSSSCESGLAVEAISDDGHIVKLDDGSLWEINASDRSAASTWSVTTEIVACDDKLFNVDDNETAYAVRLQ
jgi:TPR repeat protein